MDVPARFDRFVFRLRISDGPLFVPEFKGPTLRGAFGEMFRKAVCVVPSRKTCTGCVSSECPYMDVFETADEAGRTVPRPFVIEPPDDPRRELEKGEPMEFSLVLFGRALRLLPLFAMVFDEIGRRGFGVGRSGKYQIEGIYTERDQPLYPPGGTFSMGEGCSVSDFELENGCRYRFDLDFVTPVQVREDGHVVRPAFVDLVKVLMRRLKLLYRFHSEQRIPQDLVDHIVRVSEQADVPREPELSPARVTRYSRRQGRRVIYQGFVGRISVEGDLAELFPWLFAGTYVHVGKGCTFGMGRYKLSVGKSSRHT